MTDLEKKDRAISITGVCTSCDDRRNCDFTKGINSYVRNQKCADHISDVEITVYSCDNYKPEVDNICSDSDMCIYCRQEV